MIGKVKKCVLALSSVVLTALQISGCGASQAGSREEQVTDRIVESAVLQDELDDASADKPSIEQAAQHLLTVWSDHLDVLERMYASELWALDYVDVYLESGDWNDLVKARTACIASARYLSELSMTEEDLSEEEYLVLAEAGVDTGYQSAEFASVADFVEQAHKVIRNQMLERLENNVFAESSIEILKAHASAERDAISIMCQYSCDETNYLLLTLGDEAVSKSYWSAMKENYSVLSSGQSEWCAVEAELEAAVTACLDKYEDVIIKKADLISMAEAELYQMTQIIENEDLESLMASAHTMDNVPYLLPCPAWYAPHTSKYLSGFMGEDGSVTYPESGDDLGDDRQEVFIQAEGVTEEKIAAYIDTAKDYALDTWKAEDSGAWYISMPDYNVKIDCKDDTALIHFSGEDITFTPIWYILK